MSECRRTSNIGGCELMGKSEITLYTTPQCDIKVEVSLQNGMVWLIKKVMGNLFEIISVR